MSTLRVVLMGIGLQLRINRPKGVIFEPVQHNQYARPNFKKPNTNPCAILDCYSHTPISGSPLYELYP